ncbi:putative nucleotide-diphospho-sugar transferase [Plasmopara halstedii]
MGYIRQGYANTIWRRPKTLYLIGGGWILCVCWYAGSFAGLDKYFVRSRPILFRSENADVNSQLISLKLPAADSGQSFAVEVKPSQEVLTMGAEFYTSNFSESDTSTTIILNVYKGRPDALTEQLIKALTQKHVDPPKVWVMCFNSPMEKSFRHVVDEVKRKYPLLAQNIQLTVSDFNYKFHGRFLLAYMATTKYVLIVDDDKAIDENTVRDYLKYMNIRKGVWGNNGHRRAATFEGYKSWPRNFTGQAWAEQDYLSGMWFLEQSWLEYFMKERPPSWATSEDMHLSHVMRKYLNLNTYGGRVAIGKTLPRKPKGVQATQGSALDLREYIFDHELGRGNKVVSVNSPIETLVYAESVGDLEDYMVKLDACTSSKLVDENTSYTDVLGPWCKGGKTAAVFRGAKDQDVNGLIVAAEKLCAKTSCEYFSVKPKIRHGIRYFNMREGFGQQSTGVELPFQTGASDVMLSLVGILNNVLPKTFFVPDVASMSWPETDAAKRNRLKIYHRTVLLAVDIHQNSKINGKVIDGDVNEDSVEFASKMETLVWQRGASEDSFFTYHY